MASPFTASLPCLSYLFHRDPHFANTTNSVSLSQVDLPEPGQANILLKANIQPSEYSLSDSYMHIHCCWVRR